MKRIRVWFVVLLVALTAACSSEKKLMLYDMPSVSYKVLSSGVDLNSITSAGLDELTIEVATSGSWEVELDSELAAWAELLSATSGSGAFDLKLKISKNSGLIARSGCCTITTDEGQTYIALSQRAALSTSLFSLDFGEVSTSTTLEGIIYQGTGVASCSLLLTTAKGAVNSESDLRSYSIPSVEYLASGKSYLNLADTGSLDLQNITIDSSRDCFIAFGLNQISGVPFNGANFALQYRYSSSEAWVDLDYERSATEVDAWGYVVTSLPANNTNSSLYLRLKSASGVNLVDDIRIVQKLASENFLVTLEVGEVTYDTAEFKGCALHMPQSEVVSESEVSEFGFLIRESGSQHEWTTIEGTQYSLFEECASSLNSGVTYDVKSYVSIGGVVVESAPLTVTTLSRTIDIMSGLTMEGYLAVGESGTFSVVVPYNGELAAEDIAISAEGLIFSATTAKSSDYVGFTDVMTFTAEAALVDTSTIVLSYQPLGAQSATLCNISVFDSGVATLLDFDAEYSAEDGTFDIAKYSNSTSQSAAGSFSTLALPGGIGLSTSDSGSYLKWQSANLNAAGVKVVNTPGNAFSSSEISPYISLSAPVNSGAPLSGKIAVDVGCRTAFSDKYTWYMELSVDGGTSWIAADNGSALDIPSAVGNSIFSKSFSISEELRSEDLGGSLKVRLYFVYNEGTTSAPLQNMTIQSLNITTTK